MSEIMLGLFLRSFWETILMTGAAGLISLVAGLPLGLALVMVSITNGILFLYQLQLGCVTGVALARFLWRVYPNSIEFFEGGVSQGGVTLIPWAQVEVRPSQYFADRLVVVLRPAVGSVVADTKMAQVSDALREQLLATS